MDKFDLEAIVKLLVYRLLENLEELKQYENKEGEQFCYGEKVAYIECLEILQMCEKVKEYGLDFDIEERYPL